ncbi:MAG: BrnT family toxin [Candidatus Poribacteria bacterium]|nr:BrnT family toxin [Candidatus Poribacteria bacterium]
MKFKWDKNKAATNLSKHNVSFDEAKTVFRNHFYIIFDDPVHSSEEDRYIIIGQSVQRNLLFVSFTDKENVIRLISAREVTPSERQKYQEG